METMVPDGGSAERKIRTELADCEEVEAVEVLLEMGYDVLG